jgi:hypothetical protein
MAVNDFLEAANDDSSTDRYEKLKKEEAGTQEKDPVKQRYNELKQKAKEEYKKQQEQKEEGEESEEEQNQFITY